MLVGTALASAFAYAVAMVLQQRSACQVDDACALRASLVVELLRKPWWIAGIIANLIAFGLRAVALDHGSLALVQPITVSGLLFALLLEALLNGRQVSSRDTWAGIALVVGLASFLVAASPSDGLTSPPLLAWLALGLWMTPLVVVGLAIARRRFDDTRARSLAFAGGLLLAVTAALTKQTMTALSNEGLGIVWSWPPYALAAVGAVGLVVTQSAFQAGSLRITLPVLAVVEPLASIVIGTWIFEEQLQTTAPARLAELLGLAVLVVGVVALTTGTLSHQPAAAPATAPAPAAQLTRSGGSRLGG